MALLTLFLQLQLFAALRGGGSAFGVVIEMAFRAHTPPQNGLIGVIGDFSVVPDAKDPEGAWQALIRELVALQPALSDAGLSGYSYIVRNIFFDFFLTTPVLTPFFLSPSSVKLRTRRSSTSSPGPPRARTSTSPRRLSLSSPHPEIDFNIRTVSHSTWFKLWSRGALFSFSFVVVVSIG